MALHHQLLVMMRAPWRNKCENEKDKKQNGLRKFLSIPNNNTPPKKVLSEEAKKRVWGRRICEVKKPIPFSSTFSSFLSQFINDETLKLFWKNCSASLTARNDNKFISWHK